MTLSSREMVLALTTGALTLFGVSAVLSKPKFREWTEVRKQQAEVLVEMEQDRQLLAQREKLAADFDELSKQLPQYPADKKIDVYWLSVMDRLASKHGVKISKRQAGEEKNAGDVFELPIQCTDWEGSLDSIVHFLFDMQSSGAMLDIRQLLIKSKGKGLLRGRFSLYCAYTREVQPEK